MKRQPSLLSVAYNLPSSTIIHRPKKYKPLTSDSIIPDASVSTRYIRQGKERKKNGRREKDVREKEGGLSLLQCLNDKIGGNLGMEASRFLLVLVSGGGCLVSAIWSGGGNMWFKIMGKADEPWYGKLENCHRSILGLKQKNNSAGWKLFLLDSGNMPISTALYKGRRN